jgi:hypothetical protein
VPEHPVLSVCFGATPRRTCSSCGISPPSARASSSVCLFWSNPAALVPRAGSHRTVRGHPVLSVCFGATPPRLFLVRECTSQCESIQLRPRGAGGALGVQHRDRQRLRGHPTHRAQRAAADAQHRVPAHHTVSFAAGEGPKCSAAGGRAAGRSCFRDAVGRFGGGGGRSGFWRRSGCMRGLRSARASAWHV